MKKIIFSIAINALIVSCAQKNEIWISNSDVDKPIKNILTLDKNYQYSSYTILVKGNVDDTILINDKYKLCCKIDTIIKCDFYGGNKNLILDYAPYKAKKGDLEITHYAD